MPTCCTVMPVATTLELKAEFPERGRDWRGGEGLRRGGGGIEVRKRRGEVEGC